MKNRAGIASTVVKIGVMAAFVALASFASHGAAHRFTMILNYSGAVAYDVPTLIKISTLLIEGFDYDAAGDGTHFEIADENGAILPYEIDTWNPSDESLLWVKVPVFQNGICQPGIGDAGASVTFLTANLNETGNGRIMRSFCLGKPNAVFRRDCIDIFRPLAGVKSEQHLLHGIFVMNSIENKFHGYSFVLPPKGTPVLR